MSKGVEECEALRTSTCNAATHEGYFFLQGCCVVLLVAWGLSPKHRQVAKDIDVDGSLVMPNQAQHVGISSWLSLLRLPCLQSSSASRFRVRLWGRRTQTPLNIILIIFDQQAPSDKHLFFLHLMEGKISRHMDVENRMIWQGDLIQGILFPAARLLPT